MSYLFVSVHSVFCILPSHQSFGSSKLAHLDFNFGGAFTTKNRGQYKSSDCLDTRATACNGCHWILGDILRSVSISDKISYGNISWSLEAARIVLKLFNRSEIRQAPRQYCCRCACKISKRCDNLNYQPHGFETSRDLTIGILSDIETGPWLLYAGSPTANAD